MRLAFRIQGIKTVFVILLALLSFDLKLCFADSVIEVVVVANQAEILVEPTPQSEVITSYPKGTRLLVFEPSKKGFYSAYFEEPVYGYSEGWVDHSKIKILRVVPIDLTLAAERARRKSLAWAAEKGLKADHIGSKVTTRLFFDLTQFRQTAFHPADQLNLNAAVDLDFQKKHPSIEYGGAVFGTLLPLSKRLSEVSVRYFRLNAYLGYTFILDPAVKFSLIGDLNFAETFTDQSNLGYSPLIYPMIYPKLEYVITPKISTLVKAWFSPVGKRFWTLKEHDVGGELWFFFRLENRRNLATCLSARRMIFRDETTSTSFNQTSYSISVGYTAF
jgi:hypothetical protein